MAENANHSPIRLLGNIWNRLTEPAASIKEPERRRQARLLASLLVAFILLVIPLSVASNLLTSVVPPSNNPGLYLAVGLAVLFAVAYGLNRAGHYTLAAVLSIGILSGSVFGVTLAIFAGANPNWDPTDAQPLVFLVVPVLFASMLLPLPATIVLTVINAAGVLVLPLFFPDITLAAIVTDPLLSILAVSLLILLTAYHRNRLEMDRQAEMTKKIDQLTALSQASQAVTASLELDQVLAEIVSLASEAVNSDYTSVVLVDETGNMGRSVENLPGVPAIERRIRDEGLTSWIVRSGQTVIIDEIGKDGAINSDLGEGAPRFANPLIVEAGVKSVAGLPMMIRGNILGVLYLHSLQPAAFHSQQPLLTTFANQAAIAIENAQLFNSLDQEKARLELLYRLSQRLPENLDTRDVAQRALDDLRAVLGALRGIAFIREPDSNRLRLVAVSGYDAEPVEMLDERIGIQVGNGLAGWVAAQRQPALLDDVSENEHWIPILGLDNRVRSALSVPLVSRDELQGVLSIYSEQVGFFNDGHRQIAESAAATVAATVANAQLYEQAQHRALEQETLREAVLALTTALDRDEVVKRILARLQEVVPYDSASVQLLKEDRLEIVGGRGFRNLPDLLGLSFPVDGDNPNSEVVRTRAPFIVEDAPAVYAGFQDGPDSQAVTRSWLGVPMLVGEHLVGMIALDKREPEFYTQEHARLAEAFAAQAAVAIENSRLFQAEREQRELSKALEEAAAAVNSTLHLEQVLDRILEQVEQVVPGDAFNIMLIKDGKAGLVRGRGYEHPDDHIPHFNVTIAEYPSLMKMTQTGEPIVVPDTSADPDWVPPRGREWRRSYVAAPIRVGGTTVGFLNVIGTRPGQFGLADARRLQVFGNHVGAAIHNARLYREQLNYADRLEERVQERTAQLQAQYARLAAILSSASDGIVVTDSAGEIVQSNPVAEAWLTQTLPPKDAARLREAVQGLAARAEERPEKVLELTGLDLELSAAPVSEPGAEEAAAVVAIHDVSHLKALDRMKTRFVSSVSHELRTPVTTIKLYTELIRRHPEKWEEYVATLTQEADRQARLVEDILQISIIDAGRLEMNPRPTSLAELAEIAVINHLALAQERELTLEHRPAPPSPPKTEGAGGGEPVALVDPERMMQALNNLVVNAINYTPAGGKVVISTSQAQAEGRAWATATVEDTGMGIPEEELPHVFERFFRGEQPQLMQLPGTGLGLAIVKEIVELHGGRVTLESQVGEGTTFTAWLPLAD